MGTLTRSACLAKAGFWAPFRCRKTKHLERSLNPVVLTFNLQSHSQSLSRRHWSVAYFPCYPYPPPPLWGGWGSAVGARLDNQGSGPKSQNQTTETIQDQRGQHRRRRRPAHSPAAVPAQPPPPGSAPSPACAPRGSVHTCRPRRPARCPRRPASASPQKLTEGDGRQRSSRGCHHGCGGRARGRPNLS